MSFLLGIVGGTSGHSVHGDSVLGALTSRKGKKEVELQHLWSFDDDAGNQAHRYSGHGARRYAQLFKVGQGFQLENFKPWAIICDITVVSTLPSLPMLRGHGPLLCDRRKLGKRQ